MKILITSDTHGYYGRISDLILAEGDFDLMLHAGDGVEDCKNIFFETGLNYYVVKGNNDFFSNETYNKIIDLDGHKILLTHGHKENVDFSMSGLIEKAKQSSCDIVIFGHIHRYVEIKRTDILILNPGSPSLPRDGKASAMIMTTEKGIKIEKVLLDWGDKMSGLINLISEYSSRLAILPVLAMMNAIITIIIYFINSKKILKFIPSFIIGIVALIVGIYSITIFNSPMGLNTAWIAVFLGSSSLVGICVGFTIDLITSVKNDMGIDSKSKNNVNKYFGSQKKFRAKRKRAKENIND